MLFFVCLAAAIARKLCDASFSTRPTGQMLFGFSGGLGCVIIGFCSSLASVNGQTGVWQPVGPLEAV